MSRFARGNSGILNAVFDLVDEPGTYTAILPVYGQSLSVGARGVPAVTTTAVDAAKAKTLTRGPRCHLNDLGVSGNENNQILRDNIAGLVDLVETDDTINGDTFGETPCSGTASFLLGEAAGGDDDLITFASSRGSMRADELEAGEVHYGNLAVVMDRARDLAPNTPRMPALFYIQGTADAAANTDPDEYIATVRQLRRDVERRAQVLYGQTSRVPLFFFQLHNLEPLGNAAGGKAIALAHKKLHDVDPDCHLVAPGYWAIGEDQLHDNAASYFTRGEYFGKGFVDERAGRSTCLEPVRIEVVGSSVVITTSEAVGGLVFDTTQVTEPQIAGTVMAYEWFDDGGATLTAASVTGPNEITLTLDQAPSGTMRLGHATQSEGGNTYGPGTTPTNKGARGPTRDHATPNPNRMIIFEEELTGGVYEKPAPEPRITFTPKSFTYTPLAQGVIDTTPDYWKRPDVGLETGGVIDDYTGNGRTWTQGGTPTGRVILPEGDAFDFTDNGETIIGPEDAAGIGSVTYAMVISRVQDAVVRSIIGSASPPGGVHAWSLEGSSGNGLKYFAKVGNSGNGGNWATMAAGALRSVVFRYDAFANRVRWYVDGVLVRDESGIQQKININPTLMVGASTARSGAFSGTMRDLIIYHASVDPAGALQTYLSARAAGTE